MTRQFDRPMIEDFLRREGLKFLKDSDGDFRVGFSYDEDVDGELTYLLMATGTKDTVYQIAVLTTKRIQRDRWAQAMRLCNQWNNEHRWPKAYLDTENVTGGSAAVVLEYSIDLAPGVHQDFVDAFTRHVIAGGMQFWTWAHKDMRL